MQLLCGQLSTLIHIVLLVPHVLIEFVVNWIFPALIFSANKQYMLMFYTFQKLKKKKSCKEKGWSLALYFRFNRNHECFHERCHLSVCVRSCVFWAEGVHWVTHYAWESASSWKEFTGVTKTGFSSWRGRNKIDIFPKRFLVSSI